MTCTKRIGFVGPKYGRKRETNNLLRLQRAYPPSEPIPKHRTRRENPFSNGINYPLFVRLTSGNTTSFFLIISYVNAMLNAPTTTTEKAQQGWRTSSAPSSSSSVLPSSLHSVKPRVKNTKALVPQLLSPAPSKVALLPFRYR